MLVYGIRTDESVQTLELHSSWVSGDHTTGALSHLRALTSTTFVRLFSSANLNWMLVWFWTLSSVPRRHRVPAFREHTAYWGRHTSKQTLIFQGGIYSHHNQRVLQEKQQFSLPYVATIYPDPTPHKTEAIIIQFIVHPSRVPCHISK